MVEPNLRDERRARGIERTKQDIIEAAARVFAQAGFHAATMAAIAREAGFTAASLYTYFESKEAIFQALRDDTLRRVLATYDLAVPSGLSYAQRLELLLQHQLSVVVDRLHAMRVLFDVPPPRQEERSVMASFLDRAAHFLAEGAERELRVPPREAAEVLFGLTHVWVMAWLSGEVQPDPARVAAHIADLFLHGVARRTQPTPNA